ncbi:GIY-YIG nuclease family protein [Bacillus cereus]|nr:GIY-YIG nuclease family protein [Bacillus cereus]MDA1872109.1 GIY-YIG nuclease family protein [Bacillus cereus]HCL0440807.1 GIY-YIG nuclease family protein [Salmonella enterica subsp. enterica serovar Typhi]
MPIQNDSIRRRFLYVLELENGNYYVGQTIEDTEKRIEKHFKGKGSAWTRKHHAQAIKEIIDLGALTYTQAEKIENQYAIKYMKNYGWEKVRGGFFTLTDNEKHLKTLKNHQRMNKVKNIDFI